MCILCCLTVVAFAQQPKEKGVPTTEKSSDAQLSPASSKAGAKAEAAAKPEIIQLTAEDIEQLKTWFERVKQLATEAEHTKTWAEKAVADFNAAQGQLDAARAMRTALFYKLCAERKIDPSTVELTADGIMKKPATEKKTSALSPAPQPVGSK